MTAKPTRGKKTWRTLQMALLVGIFASFVLLGFQLRSHTMPFVVILAIPLAISIVFGLMASTVLVLLVIPALYTILDDLGLTTVTTHTEEN